ncbi:MAG: flagellar motor switch protein FliM [Calditrichia bacterium]
MAEVLSQQEIDNLLNNMESGDSPQEEILDSSGENQEIYDYDFRRPNRVSKDQIRTLRTIHESFSEQFGFYLASKLQTMVSIDLISVDQLRYSEFILSISNPSCIFVFDIDGGDGSGILELSPQLVLLIVERMLGGEGSPDEEPRVITYLEQNIVNPVLDRALSYLSGSWKVIHELQFKRSHFESNPDFVQVAPASEIVLILTFEIKIGDVAHLMNICYPTFALEDVIQKLSTQLFSVLMSGKNKAEYREKVREHLEKTPLDVIVELGTTSITLRDLIQLKKGDILKTGSKIDEDLNIKVEDRTKFKGIPGIYEDKIAIKITDLVDKDLITDNNNFNDKKVS